MNIQQFYGYNDDSKFKANFDKMHPKLAEFMLDAVMVYVSKRKQAGLST